jgi:hypothetical protein
VNRLSQAKLAEIKAAHDAAVAAKTSGTFTPAASGFSGGLEGGMEREGGGFNSGGGFAFNPANAGAAAAGGPQQPQDDPAFKDRNFPDEPIVNDQEFMVVALVQVDPPPLAPEATTAPTETPAAPAQQPAANAAH